MPAVQFSDQDFEAKVLKNKLPVMVDFFAEWCGPCKLAGPVVDKLAEEYKDKLVIGKIDVDANQATAGKFGVMSIPTVIFFKDGKEVERMSGFGGEEGYLKLIKKVLGE
ncbi:thioredoxin [Candidatus Beckwithbacteria bacterium CG23_combo_of_CG06-09_8_20_14_all_47_9]|uniref:Thioredoxin n=1 Tax=Candidatus Beckwithbacteria bacterium CG23_combo_of_CG06-09_8_20_14_all_47_9 TaxID=1974498 RepID=A0A2H0B3S4_9BACT|nr:MAG: thioredoxin [Candidatus Beckwithbacteria bacterium CG23_combo_of_CG06-09_8_20_14_all_47_9]